MRGLLISTLTALVFFAGAGGAEAQQPVTVQPVTVQSPILLMDSERLYQQSAFGLRVAAEIEESGRALAAENRRIEAELGAEEQLLTDKRADTDAEAFRLLADAFDEKVQETRRTQEAKSRALTQQVEQERLVFLKAAAPVLEALMKEAGAGVVLEVREVFLSSSAIDVTDTAIARIDAVLGDGAD